MTQKTNSNPWTMDVRVRERNLKAGSLTDKDLEKYLAGLPDLADQSEAFGTSQPALEQPIKHVPVVVAQAAIGDAMESEPDDLDDEDDEDEDDDLEAGGADVGVGAEEPVGVIDDNASGVAAAEASPYVGVAEEPAAAPVEPAAAADEEDEEEDDADDAEEPANEDASGEGTP